MLTALELIAAVLLGAYGLIAFLIAARLTRAKRRVVPADVASLARVHLVSRQDRLALVGSFAPVAGSDRAVILVHGRNACRGWEFNSSSAALVAHLQQQGFSVLLLDLRGHGESAKARLTFGLRERLDVLGAVDWLRTHGIAAGRIGVIGMSMGGVAALLAAAEEPAIGAVVSDSAFADFGQVLRAQFSRLSGLPNGFLWGGLLAGRVLTGHHLGEFRPLEVVAQVRAATLLVHAKSDPFISSHHAQTLSQAMRAEHWITPGSSHLASYRDQPEQYAQRVTAFLGIHLGSEHPGKAQPSLKQVSRLPLESGHVQPKLQGLPA